MGSTLRGIGIRAALLLLGVVLVGIWLVSLALELAGAAIHFLLVAGLLLAVAGALSYVARRFRRRL